MRIGRTISGPKKDTSSTYGQQLKTARNTVENILSSQNKQWIKYVLTVAKLKIRGDDFITLKKISDRGVIELKIPMEKMRLINIHINDLDPNGAKVLVEKSQRALN